MPKMGMRLLLISQDFPPARGGIQTYAYELAKRFAARCEDFVVLAPGPPGGAPGDAGLPFEVRRVAGPADQFTLRAAFPVRRLVRERRLDTVFAAQWFGALPALGLRRRGRVRRLFVAAHGREVVFEPRAWPGPARSVYRGLRRRVYRTADALFPVSTFVAGLVEAAGGDPIRMTVVNNGTDPTLFAPADAIALRAALGLGHRPTILTVCRLIARKGVDATLRALPRVRGHLPDVVYLVVGDGPDLPRLRALAAELGVEEHVRFLPGVDYDLTPAYYNAADVVTMPCRDDPPEVEGFGIVFLEANACGKPVVGTYAGGIPDAIRHGETGLLVEPDDRDRLADAIVTLLTTPDTAARLGRQGREHVLREANWDAVAHRIFETMTACG
jgi:phosphatidylinositol alpha-1,6-mannosyltransferase